MQSLERKRHQVFTAVTVGTSHVNKRLFKGSLWAQKPAHHRVPRNRFNQLNPLTRHPNNYNSINHQVTIQSFLNSKTNKT